MITVPVTALSMTRKKKDNYMRKNFYSNSKKECQYRTGPLRHEVRVDRPVHCGHRSSEFTMLPFIIKCCVKVAHIQPQYSNRNRINYSDLQKMF